MYIRSFSLPYILATRKVFDVHDFYQFLPKQQLKSLCHSVFQLLSYYHYTIPAGQISHK